MLSSDIPDKIPLPFADSGTKNTIPTASQIGITPGAASLTDGFPPLTFTPTSAGGIPPAGADFNGIFNMITAVQQWQSAGGIFKYDSAFSTEIGGYPKGAVLMSDDNASIFISLIDNNTDDPNSGTSVNWALLASATANRITRFTSNGTYTVPAGVFKIYVSGCAGGGGGGGSHNTTSASSGGGAGGGAGQSIIRQPYTVAPGQSVSITIGGGGSPGAVGGAGGSGGNTVIGSLVTLTGGGGGGQPGVASVTNSNGGWPSSPGYPMGSYGGDSGSALGGGSYGGPGASSPFGGGGRLTKGNALDATGGYQGHGYGSGGGGAGGITNNATANGATGGAGSPGLVIIEW